MTYTQLSKLIIQFLADGSGALSKEDIAIMVLSNEFGINNRKKIYILRQLFNIEEA